MTGYVILSNDGRWLVLDIYQRIYRLVKGASKRGVYQHWEHAENAMADACNQFKVSPRSGLLALAIKEVAI